MRSSDQVELEPDTDPLVTEPVVHRWVRFDRTDYPNILPVIPCLADQILIASDRMSAAVPARPRRGGSAPAPLEPGQLPHELLEALRMYGASGCEGPALFKATLARARPGDVWSSSSFYAAVYRLTNLGLLRSIPVAHNRRRYFAVGAK